MRAVFLPTPPLTLSQWADQHRVISAENSPFPGRWHTNLTPYLREIMDACSDPSVHRVVILKSAQVGYTDGVLGNLTGYFIDQQPAPILLIQPTAEFAKQWSKERLAPMLRDTPRLRGKVKESGRRDSKNTISLKVFPGGYLAIVGAQSATGLASRPIRVVLGDEIDKYVAAAKGGTNFEGDPLSLAETRTQNFPNRLTVLGSTPSYKETSRICAEYELSDQRVFLVPCPHCGYRQALKWSNVHWENQDPATVTYTCGEITSEGELAAGCGKPIPESAKAAMVQAGEWVPQRPGRPTRGYRIWAAYSLLTTWSVLVERFLRAKDKPEQLHSFVNEVLGEPWQEKGEAVEYGALVGRRESFAAEMPKDAGFLTAGVDVQGDRLEASVWAWGIGEEAWVLRHETLWGNPAEPDVWKTLDLFLGRPWQHELGKTVKIGLACIDSGGHHTDQVYRFCRGHRQAIAIKGSSENGAAPVGQVSRKNRANIPLVHLGTIALKDSLYGRLRIERPGPGYVHFPFLEEEYFRQLTAEAARTQYQKGRMTRRYEKVYERNEALDCAVYALAALFLSGPHREQLAKLVTRMGPDAPAAAPEPPRGVQAPKRLPRRRNWITDL